MSDKTIEVSSANFQADVLESQQPVLVDFWATWCQPCKMIAPIVDQIASEYQGKITVGKLDTDANQDILMKYGVRSIPTLILFKGGEPVVRITGFQPKEKILGKLQAHL
jgi:thioredoxin 1